MKFSVLACIVLLAAFEGASADGFRVNKMLGRGINLGNMLDAPSEGEWGLGALRLPEKDPDIILSVHYYLPFTFTHQKASWVKGSEQWEVAWTGDYFEKKSIADDFEYLVRYAGENKVPVNIGEFGAIKFADMDSRARWTAYCSRLFERMGFSWSYWEFCSNFGIYDPEAKKFRDTLVSALISKDTSTLKTVPLKLKTGNSILKNGDFSLGILAWSIMAKDGKVKDSVENGTAELSIQNPGPFSYSIQLAQDSLTLNKDARYVFSFDAWSAGPKTICAKVQDVEFHSSYMLFKCVPLTPKRRHFIKVFTMAQTRQDCRAAFDVGGVDTGKVYIANVALSLLDSGKKARKR